MLKDAWGEGLSQVKCRESCGENGALRAGACADTVGQRPWLVNEIKEQLSAGAESEEDDPTAKPER